MNIRKLTLTGLMTALVCLATVAISVPIPFTNGYIHLGDSMVFLAAILLGLKYGALAGGVGSMLADLILGYPQWAIPTLIIKSIMAIIVALIYNNNTNKFSLNIHLFLSMSFGGIWMVIGYYFASAIIYENYITPLSSIPFNILQFVIGILISFSILPLIKKISPLR